ncbi:MAG TPA: pitrilysin family protein, partial [Sandaracinaceae bacterium]
MATIAASSSGSELAARLSRRLRSKNARVAYEGAVPFGERLAIDCYRLGNGLRVLLLEHHAAPVVSYHTWFRVGSRHEEPGKTGLAHFFEHMMFNETKNLPQGEFDRLIDAAGGESNAATWIDWTYYYESLPAEELPLAIRLESERMQNLVIRAPQVESEREVVMNERRMSVEDDVYGAASEALHALAYGREHPHGWPTIGWMEDIEGYRVRDCRDFYRTWYAPNNATIVVAGDLSPEGALEGIQGAYGKLAPSALPDRPAPPAPRQRAERRTTLRWPTAAEKLCLAWHAPPHAAYDAAVLEVIDELLTGGRSSRLRVRLIEELELVAELRGGISGLRHGGLFEIWISMREGQPAARALAVLDEEIARLSAEPVAASELEKIKNRIELFFLSEIETANGKASQIGFADVVTGDPGHAFVRLSELRRVTPEDVARVASSVLRPSRRSLVHV